MNRACLVLATAAVFAAPAVVEAQQEQMSFFITSVGVGDGANLGGLEGADAHCAALASAAGVTNRQWRAYLVARASSTALHSDH